MKASTNFEAQKELIAALVSAKKLSGTARHLVEYQIHQEFGFRRNGEDKIGDARGYMKLAGDLGVKRQTVMDALKVLERRNIIVIERHKAKFGNVYVNLRMINRDISQWKLNGV